MKWDMAGFWPFRLGSILGHRCAEPCATRQRHLTVGEVLPIIGAAIARLAFHVRPEAELEADPISALFLAVADKHANGVHNPALGTVAILASAVQAGVVEPYLGDALGVQPVHQRQALLPDFRLAVVARCQRNEIV